MVVKGSFFVYFNFRSRHTYKKKIFRILIVPTFLFTSLVILFNVCYILKYHIWIHEY